MIESVAGVVVGLEPMYDDAQIDRHAELLVFVGRNVPFVDCTMVEKKNNACLRVDMKWRKPSAGS